MIKGDLILISFPFSNLKQKKIRPALIISNNSYEGKDVLICGISSKNKNIRDVILENTDLTSGVLPTRSYVRNGKITYAEKSLIIQVVGHISEDKQDEVLNRFQEILQ